MIKTTSNRRLLREENFVGSSSSRQDAFDGLPDAVSEAVGAWWASIPARTKLVGACASSFALSNMVSWLQSHPHTAWAALNPGLPP